MRLRPSPRNVLAAVAMFMALWFIGTRSNLPEAPSLPPAASRDQHPVSQPQTDPATLAKDTVWTLKDGTYVIALDELYVPAGPAATRLHTLAPQKNLPALLASAMSLGAQTGVQPRLVLYPIDAPHNESTRRIVTQQVHIETDNLEAVRAATRSLGVINWTTPDYAPGHAIAQVEGDPAQVLRVADALSRLANVISATPLLAVQHAKLAVPVPNDPFFTQQWHLLKAQDSSDIDINVTPVWPTRKGAGINIGIVDDGVQITHPDLAANAAVSGHYDWNDADTDPAPSLAADDHGTAVAGLAAARGNNGVGVSGVAPEATLYGLRLIAQPTTDQEDAEAMAWKNDVIQIKNNSWGPAPGTPSILGSAGSLWQSSVTTGTTYGRGGLGTVYVFAAGNGKESGFQGNKNAYANNIHVLAVGAVTNGGDSASFGEGGSHLVVSAPGESTPGIVTTDRTGANGYNPGSSEISDQDYTQTFGGTSASAPIVSGVIALMLEANPDLGWRDVKEILLRSSKQLHPSDNNWVTRDDGQPSHPIKHHEFFGGGLIDADAAVALAASWTPLGTEAFVTQSTTRVTQTIPDDPDSPLVIPITPSGPKLRVEHVEVSVNITHVWRGDLEITLTSPSGTVSTLASSTILDSGDNYSNWTFSSVRHWGESSEGTWQLSIRDDIGGLVGKFNFAMIKFSGVAPDAPVITVQPQDTAAALGSNVVLTTAAGEDSGLTYQWSRNGTPIAGKTAATLNLTGITAAQVGTYTCTLTNAIPVSSTTKPARVSVYDPLDQAVNVNNGATFITPALTTGSYDSFQWYFDDSPLADSSRITGTATAALTVRSITPADNGAYTLKAVLNGNTVTTGAANLTVRPPPDVTAPATQSIRLGASASLSLSTTGGPYTYAYTGLPKGVSYNPATGALTGRPTAAGTYTVFLAVTDGFSNSTTRTIFLTVEPVPANLIGTFNGIVARDPSLNANLGGALNLVTTSTGAFTGKLTLGTGSYSFKGQLDGAAGGPATVTVNIPLKGLLLLTIPTDNTVATGTLGTVAVSAWRNPWGKTNPAYFYATKYVFALEPPPEGDGSVWPAGYSTGSVTVTTAGAASWTLLPADGSAALKGTTTIAADGSMPLFAPVKTPVGSFLGTLLLPPPSTPPTSIAGTVSWLRRSTSSTAYANAAGFGPVALTPLGGRFAAPSSGTLLLGLPSGSNNAQLEFDGVDLGALSSALSPFTFTVATGNKIVLPVPNPTALKLTATASTGLFSGSFVLADPNPSNTAVTVKRTAKFSGVFLPNEGVGFFILPALPGTSTGTRSGSVIFTGNE